MSNDSTDSKCDAAFSLIRHLSLAGSPNCQRRVLVTSDPQCRNCSRLCRRKLSDIDRQQCSFSDIFQHFPTFSDMNSQIRQSKAKSLTAKTGLGHQLSFGGNTAKLDTFSDVPDQAKAAKRPHQTKTRPKIILLGKLRNTVTAFASIGRPINPSANFPLMTPFT